MSLPNVEIEDAQDSCPQCGARIASRFTYYNSPSSKISIEVVRFSCGLAQYRQAPHPCNGNDGSIQTKFWCRNSDVYQEHLKRRSDSILRLAKYIQRMNVDLNFKNACLQLLPSAEFDFPPITPNLRSLWK